MSVCNRYRGNQPSLKYYIKQKEDEINQISMEFDRHVYYKERAADNLAEMSLCVSAFSSNENLIQLTIKVVHSSTNYM
jgi:hypothetical protein